MSIVKTAWAFADSAYIDYDITAPVPEGSKIIDLLPIENHVMTVYDLGGNRFFAFRGSDDSKDWLNNDLRLTAGFKDATEIFKPHIKKHVIGSTQNIVFTGHSMGGDIAIFSAEYCAFSLQRPCSCIAFAPAPPSGKEFRDHYNKLPIDHTNVYIKGDFCADSTFLYLKGKRHVGKTVSPPSKLIWRIFKPYGMFQVHKRENLTQAIGKRF